MTRDTSMWSDEARARHKHSIHHYDIIDRADERAMRAGPVLAEDGYTIIIPAGRKFYNKEAARFWRSQDFEWDPDSYMWSRDTRTLASGKQYTPAAWLQSARRKFFEFYPELKEAADGS